MKTGSKIHKKSSKIKRNRPNAVKNQKIRKKNLGDYGGKSRFYKGKWGNWGKWRK